MLSVQEVRALSIDDRKARLVELKRELMQERGVQAATLIFTIEVKHRKHLADVMRRVRNTKVVNGVYRYPL